MKNKTYAENRIYLTCKGLVQSVIRGKSPSDKIAKTIKTELDKKEKYDEYLTSEDVEKMLEEVYIESIEGFKGNPEIVQERNERFIGLKKELENQGL
jgi:hypothetical protein